MTRLNGPTSVANASFRSAAAGNLKPASVTEKKVSREDLFKDKKPKKKAGDA